VSNIQATVAGGNIAFTWDDPGIGPNGSYQVAVNDDSPSVQTDPTFIYGADPGEHVCLVVTVNQDGRSGLPSAPKCVDMTG
jgi:hypothetical protein